MSGLACWPAATGTGASALSIQRFCWLSVSVIARSAIFSSTHRVCTDPSMKSVFVRTFIKKGIFVATPSIRNSESARSDRCTAVSNLLDGECVITFASNESNIGLVV